MFVTNNMSYDDHQKIDALNKKLESDPTNLDLLMERAFVYFGGYDDPNTIKCYKEIIELYPKYLLAYFFLSDYLRFSACEFEEAEKIAKSGLAIDSNRADLHLVLSWIYNDLIRKHEKDFVYHIKKTIELAPLWVNPRRDYVYYLIQKRELAEAKKIINEALSKIDLINPNDLLKDTDSDADSFYATCVTGFDDINDSKKELEDYMKKVLELEAKGDTTPEPLYDEDLIIKK